MTAWTQLDALQSRGSLADKAGSLAALHQKREETLSQFFTPVWLVRYIWETLAPSFTDPEGYYSLFDNSVGAASMFRFAAPERFALHGLDVDGELVSAVKASLDESGFDVNLVTACLSAVELGAFSAGLINPPFSIPLASPTLQPFDGVTHYGKHGPHTSALSHEYALVQALSCCDVVAAIMPRTTTALLSTFGNIEHRLQAVFALPADTFRGEGVASVNTDLLFFGPDYGKIHSRTIIRQAITPDSAPEILPDMAARPRQALARDVIRLLEFDCTQAVITLPATTDKRVILNRAGRWISLRFFDGATEGRVKNALYQQRLFSTRDHRLPKATRYKGQYQLNLDVIALQDNPYAAFDAVVATIAQAGGKPIITRDLKYGLKSILDEYRKMTVPYGRTVYRKGTPAFNATARGMAIINRHEKGAVVALGEPVHVKRSDHGFLVTTKKGTFSCEHDHFFTTFEAETKAIQAGYWEEVHPPIRHTYPQQIAALESQAQALGLGRWLSWDFQLEDLCELAFRPHGGICGWQMALGKTRLALALSLLLPGASMIVVKSRLVNELEREMRELGIDDTMFQIIRSASDIDQLAKINIISYERLRRPLHRRFPKLTLARRLKNRVANIIADEGGLLANETTAQSQALWQLGGKRHYIFDGTPSPNYPRETLALATWTVGQERSYQPYSTTRGYIDPGLFVSAKGHMTGRNAFLKDFVCFEWATNEFLDSGKGAKREVPKIRAGNLGLFRDWLGPIIKRRVQQEPAVTRHVAFPVPTLHPPISVEWDFHHLRLYIQTVEEFADWYRNYVSEQQINQRGLNLTLILARLEACFKAANTPNKVSGYARPFDGLTSKERVNIDLIAAQVAAGRRPIVFARNPSVLHRLAKALTALGITNMVFTGEEHIDKRLARLNTGIREGDLQVLLASLGVTQDGLNLPQLNTFIFYNRSYKAREEFQAIYRLIRSQQESDVYGFFTQLSGSIDDYMAQLIEWKSLASEAGLDYGEQPEDADFVHFDAFIYQFLESIPALKEKLKLARSSQVA